MACIGIDFSGGAAPWRPRMRRPTVWLATLSDDDGLRLADLRPVQELPGTAEPFLRLQEHLRRTAPAVVAIDAPFSLPAAWMGAGHADLLAKVGALPAATDRAFPRGQQLLDLVAFDPELQGPKPYRATERRWAKVNARSTLWNGARGGAPFAVACLALLSQMKARCWPWHTTGSPLFVEAFPAAQLYAWELPHDKYPKQEATDLREHIVAFLKERLEISPEQHRVMLGNCDALDATIAAFAGVAVHRGRAEMPEQQTEEGWIAIHP